MKTIRYVDEDTLEIKEVPIETTKKEVNKLHATEELDLLEQALGCDADDFIRAYDKYIKAEAKFKKLYEPFKDQLIKLHEEHPEFSKTVIIGNAKLTYVSPSVRKTIDTKKLKEEEPALAEKYAKNTDVKATIRLEEIF